MGFIYLYLGFGLLLAAFASGLINDPFKDETIPFVIVAVVVIALAYAILWPLIVVYNVGNFVRLKYRRGGR